MSNKVGRFEIQSELGHSEFCAVYKATDPENGQTVALKTIKLELFGEQAPALVQRIMLEAESAKALNSPNIAVLYGAGEMDGLFGASLEYVQGNSIGTGLDRKDGFSIWDIQDITRQTCQAFDHAHQHKIAHYSLEPSKIMSGWDGTVKILGYGISSMGAYAAQSSGAPPQILHYMSPEQIGGNAVDVRSNIFSLGAILYEMATEHKAFDGADAGEVRRQILSEMPPAPSEINRKVHPMLSELIMKALAKDVEGRYQSGRELVLDIEKCKESPTQPSESKKKAEPSRGLMGAPRKMQAAVEPVAEASITQAEEPQATVPSGTPISTPTAKAVPSADSEIAPVPKAAAAAAAGGSTGIVANAAVADAAELDLAGVPAAGNGMNVIAPQASAASTMSPIAPVEHETRKIAIDPAMDETRKTAEPPSKSFSDISELPPLKPVFIAPPPVTAEPARDTVAADAVHSAVFKNAAPEKPKVQPREIARKAADEIKKTPPKLFIYAIAAAISLVLLVIVAIAFHIHSENSEDEGAPNVAQAPKPTAETPAAQQASAAPVAAAATAPVAATATAEPVPEAPAEQPEVSVTPRYKGGKKKLNSAAPAAIPVVIPGQLTINSTPQGAQVQIDGRGDPNWFTPYNMAGLAPGQHTIILSKPGYGAETRSVDVPSGSKSFIAVQLAAVTATVAVSSDPSGASVMMDGKDTGKVTPMQISVEQLGSHSFVVHKQGYLDESTSASLQAGQTFHYGPSLRPLGSAEDIRMGGKFKKLFGGTDTSGMGSVIIKTVPKSAQVAVNNRILDKASPVDFSLDPGNYVIDVTLSGFKSIHRVITVDKGGRVVIDETLQRD